MTKIKNKEWKSPSEEDVYKVSELAFEAAKTSLSGILDKALKDASIEDLVRDILQALLVVFKTVETQDLAFEKANPDFNTHSHYLDYSLIVANALLSELEGRGKVKALSYSGFVLIAFAKAKAIQSKMSDIETLLEDDEYFTQKSAVTKSLKIILEG